MRLRILETWEYIARDDIDAADRFLAKLHKQIQALAETPGIGHRREDLAEERPLSLARWKLPDPLSSQ